MTIASSSGLSDKDIEKMVSDAEQYAESDKERKAVIEESNKAESVCHDTEKAMNDLKHEHEHKHLAAQAQGRGLQRDRSPARAHEQHHVRRDVLHGGR